MFADESVEPVELQFEFVWAGRVGRGIGGLRPKKKAGGGDECKRSRDVLSP
jgi:hypothetical protein